MDIKKNSPVLQPKTTAITTPKHSVGVTGLHARLRNPQQIEVNDPNTKANRIALLLDVSGSMSGDKIVKLRDACQSFISACNFTDTSLAIEPFGDSGENRLPLTTFGPLLMTTCASLQASGGTPMAQAMDFVLNSYSLTRCVLVSDGEPNSDIAAFHSAEDFKTAGLQCDCVHIGASTSGESVLRRIAEMTGGQYIKFTDINSFANSFKYLTPAYYAQLTSGNVTAAQLGAKEIK